MTAKQMAVKKYVVKLSAEERERLLALLHAGKHPARQLTKARILLKADASEAGEGWSDSRIAAALETSVDTVARTRQQLVEEGFEAVLIPWSTGPVEGQINRLKLLKRTMYGRAKYDLLRRRVLVAA